MYDYDFVIIGGGVIGASLAYELCHYKNSTLLLEKGSDVSLGATKANSAIIHAGYDPRPGTLKATLNVRGAQIYSSLAKKLGVTYQEQNTLVVAKNKEELALLERLERQAQENGVRGGRILSREESLKEEPLLREDIAGAFLIPSAVASPYEMTVALIEVALENGLDLSLKSEVKSIQEKEEGFLIKIEKEGESKEVSCRYIFNCAGGGAEEIASFVGEDSFKNYYVRGEYLIFDQDPQYPLKSTLFPVPDPVKGKGILVNLTPDKNVLLGPTANPTDSPLDTSSHLEILKEVFKGGNLLVKELPPLTKLIRSFSGVRTKIQRKDGKKDFLIQVSEKNERFYLLAGIDSPGLSSAPAIAEYVLKDIQERGWLAERKEEYIDSRSPYASRYKEKLNMFQANEKSQLPQGNPERIVCRCQSVREETIRDAISRWPYPLSVEGVKRRTRAGMGFCQGAFCRPRVKKLLSDIYLLPEEKIQERDEEFPLKRPPILEVKKALL